MSDATRIGVGAAQAEKGDQVTAEPVQRPCAWGGAGDIREVAQLGESTCFGSRGSSVQIRPSRLVGCSSIGRAPGFGPGGAGSIPVAPSNSAAGGGAAWKRVSFGTRRSSVQIRPTRLDIRRSSNGRTPGSGPGNEGSTPSLRAWPCGRTFSGSSIRQSAWLLTRRLWVRGPP